MGQTCTVCTPERTPTELFLESAKFMVPEVEGDIKRIRLKYSLHPEGSRIYALKEGYAVVEKEQERKIGYAEVYAKEFSYYGGLDGELPSGEGVIVKADLQYYVGGFEGGVPHGDGKESNGSWTYIGHYSAGVKTKGKMTGKDWSYTGEFLAEHFEGTGQLETSKYTYIGQFKGG